MTHNSSTLHNYFANQYKRIYGEIYKPRSKGLEFVQLKSLLENYSPYQIMSAIKIYVENSVDTCITDFSHQAHSLIREYAGDPLVAKARYALSLGRNIALRSAYYAYVDAVDSWFSSPRLVEKNAKVLEELADNCLN